jgi:phosphatidylserine/phosphatidylglycerophosphate/cardiolipin synthase-like enzyme
MSRRSAFPRLDGLATLDQFKKRPVSPGYSPTHRTFYSPTDDVHAAIGTVLSAAQHSVVILMYGYDDDDFQRILLSKLLDEQVFVQLTLDSSQAGGVHERTLLKAWHSAAPGNSIAVGRSTRHAILHDKVAIVDGLWVISGSTNWSTSGESLQANMCSIDQDALIAAEVRTVIDIQHDGVLQQMAAKVNHPA